MFSMWMFMPKKHSQTGLSFEIPVLTPSAEICGNRHSILFANPLYSWLSISPVASLCRNVVQKATGMNSIVLPKLVKSVSWTCFTTIPIGLSTLLSMVDHVELTTLFSQDRGGTFRYAPFTM